jgi:hypothetical protein
LLITEIELRLIASAAIAGESGHPASGYRNAAAILAP